MVVSHIRIVTDSTSDVPADVRKALGIEMVSLKVHFGEETFHDGVDIDAGQFYGKLAQAESLPTTSQPSPVDFLEVYKRLAAEQPGVEIISIHLSAALSGTYQSAVLAKSLLEEQAGLNVIDSRSASYGVGMLAVAAAEAAKQGKSAKECIQLVHDMRRATKLYFLVDTLEFLQKGGRIGKASAVLGSLLNIKPILTVDEEGEVAPVDKVRGHKKATARIIELLKADFAGKEVDAVIAHSEAREVAEQFSAQLGEHFQIRRLSYTSIGPVIGTHVGPGAVAVFMSPVQ